MKTNLPFTKKQIEEISNDFPTPFHIYDEKEIVENAKQFNKAFSVLPGFKNYFAVKALPNPYILTILKNQGMGMDCSSLPELLLSEKIGVKGESVMFTSNDTPADEFIKAKEIGAIINLDDISHISFLEETTGLPEFLSFRYNPGLQRTGNMIIGNPREAKYGLTKNQIFEAYSAVRDKGVKRFGIHTMLASNELNQNYFVETAKMMFELVIAIKQKTGIKIELINLGGGIGIPYSQNDKEVSYEFIAEQTKELYNAMIKSSGLSPNIVMENGRAITGPYGYLITKVRHIKQTYKNFAGCDACMADLMRPALYGAYHKITVLGKEFDPLTHKYDITGSLCENNDKFAIDRALPEIKVGDVLAIHNTGAHGHAMGFNYNGKLRHSEILLRPNNEVMQIRRAETVEDYFSTLDFNKLDSFIDNDKTIRKE